MSRDKYMAGKRKKRQNNIKEQLFYCLKADAEQCRICYNKVIMSVRT